MKTTLFHKAWLYIVHFISTIPTKILYLLEFQLFITILSLPILISWGLPISLLSPIGNLIFTPWLLTFLTLSSLLFFMQILCIENSFIIYLLEKFNQLFFYILDYGSSYFMVSCPCPSYFFLLIIPIILFFIISIRISSIYKRVFLLFLFSSFLFFSFKYLWAPKDQFEHFTNKNKTILLINHDSKILLLDCGALAEGRNAQSWVRYQLIPKFLKMGIDHLDCLIAPKPSSKLIESIAEFAQNMPIKHLYIQKWDGRLSLTGWKCWKDLLKLIKQKQITLTLLNKSLKINLNNNFIIDITQKNIMIRKGSLHYNVLGIEAILNRKIINLI